MSQACLSIEKRERVDIIKIEEKKYKKRMTCQYFRMKYLNKGGPNQRNI